MFEQPVTPNLDPYMYDDNGTLLRDWLGWCMNYVRTAFGVARKIPSAWQSWAASSTQHADRNFPKNVYFAVYFSYFANLDGTGVKNWGHVVICLVHDDGSMEIWSAPISHKPFADKWSSIEEVERKYGVTFAGWTEDVNGTLVIQPAAAAPATPPAQKYEVVETYPNGKQIQLNKQPTNLWGMNYDFDYMAEHPVEVHNQGEIWVVTNKVHHADGYDYYRRDGQVDGFNVLDCDDYTPPAPDPVPAPEPEEPEPTQPTEPVTPPAAPEEPTEPTAPEPNEPTLPEPGTVVQPDQPAPTTPTKTKVIVPPPHEYYTVWQLLVATFKRMGGKLQPIIDTAKDQWNSLPDGVKRVVHAVWQAVGGAVLTAVTAPHSTLDVQGGLFTAYTAGLSAAKNAIVTWVKNRASTL